MIPRAPDSGISYYPTTVRYQQGRLILSSPYFRQEVRNVKKKRTKDVGMFPKSPTSKKRCHCLGIFSGCHIRKKIINAYKGGWRRGPSKFIPRIENQIRPHGVPPILMTRQLTYREIAFSCGLLGSFWLVARSRTCVEPYTFNGPDLDRPFEYRRASARAAAVPEESSPVK